MQTIIENLLTVVGNIPGIDEAVYSNIYDIELTDNTVFVIVPGDISENITAYLVNGSILLMSKVMLVLKSKYIETNMVITSKDNIKEFSLDNCSGVYNVIKYKLIYKREDCGDSYEGMFVKSINGLHGEVFLDIPLKISDLPNDAGYITEEDLPDYSDKFAEIDSSISDVSIRVHDIEKDYTTREYVDEKISEIVIESSVKSVNGMTGDVILNIPEKVSDLTQDIDYITEDEADSKYMQKGDVPTDVYTKEQIDNKFTDSSTYNTNTYATKTELNTSINNVSTYISNTYAKKSDIPTIDTYTKSEIDDKDADVLTLAKGYTEQEVLELSNYVDSTFATKEEIPTDYVKTEDYNKFVSDQGTIDETQNEAIAANTLDIADINTNITNVEADIKEIEDLLVSVNDVIKSNIPATLSLDDDTKKLPENILDLIDYRNLVIDDTYARKEDIPVIPDYTLKFTEIDSSISDVSTRVKSIEDDYLKSTDKSELENKIDSVDSNYKKADEALDIKIGANTEEINKVSGRVSDIEADYVKGDQIKDFITVEDLPDYTEKFNDIDSSIENVSTRVKNIEDDYLNSEDKTELEGKISDVENKIPTDYVKNSDYIIKVSEIDSSISDVSNRVKNIEDDYVKADDIKDNVKSDYLEGRISDISSAISEGVSSANKYTDGQIEFLNIDISSKIFKLNVSVNNEINRIWEKENTQDSDISDIKDFIDDVPNTYLKIEDLPDYTEKFTEIDSSISDVSTRVKSIEDDYLKSTDKTELEGKILDVADNIPTDYVKIEDYNSDKSAQTAIDEAQNSAIEDISGDLENKVDKSTLDDYYTNTEVDTKVNDVIVNASVNYLLKTDYVAPDVDKKYVEDRLADVSTEILRVEDLIPEIPDYTDKFNEIDSSIDDISTRVNTNTENIASVDTKIDDAIERIDGEIEGHTEEINSVSGRVSAIEDDYVKSDDIKDFITESDLPDYTDKFNEIDSSISDVSTRVKSIEDDYVKHDELPIIPDYTDKFNEIDSSIDDISTRLSDNYVTNSSVSINYATKDELEEIRLFKFPNATIIGSPKIDNGQISEFSLEDYLEFPFMVDFRQRRFEINFHLKTGDNVTSLQNILDSEYGLAFAVRNSRFVLAVSSNGTSWNVGEIVGSYTVLPDRNYRIKITYDGTNYQVWYLENLNEEYKLDASKSAPFLFPYPKQMYIGVGGVYASSKNFFTGMINLNYANLKINGELVWQGMDDVGLATRMAVDMSNIDAAGEQKVKDIIKTEGYITEIPDSYATKDELNTSIANVSSWVSNNYAKKTSLDLYLLISDAQNTYATQGQLNGLSGRVEELDGHITEVYTYYDPKISNINSSVSDISTRLANIKVPTDYVHTDTYNVKIAEIDSSISNVSTRIKNIEDAGYATTGYVDGKISDLNIDDYLKSSDAENTYLKIEDLPDYSSKFNEIDSSISNVSTRVKTVENKFDDYVLSSYIEGRISDISSAISSGDSDTLTNANKYTDDEIKKLPNYSVKISEIDSSISDVSSRINTLEKSNFLTKTLADTYYVHGSDYNTDKAAQEQTNTTLSQDIIRLDGLFVKTNTSIGILNTSVNLLEVNKLENLTPGTIVKTEGGMKLEFIADLTTTSENAARAIQINTGEQYYYELISGFGHLIYDSYGSIGADIMDSQIFTWYSSSFNTKDSHSVGYINYSMILQRGEDENCVGKLYRYLGWEEAHENSLSDYIDLKIDSKIGDINTILESI